MLGVASVLHFSNIVPEPDHPRCCALLGSVRLWHVPVEATVGGRHSTNVPSVETEPIHTLRCDR